MSVQEQFDVLDGNAIVIRNCDVFERVSSESWKQTEFRIQIWLALTAFLATHDGLQEPDRDIIVWGQIETGVHGEEVVDLYFAVVFAGELFGSDKRSSRILSWLISWILTLHFNRWILFVFKIII